MVNKVISTENGYYRFELYSPLPVNIFSLNANYYIGCNTMDVEIQFEPTNGTTITLNQKPGRLLSIPPANVMYETNQSLIGKIHAKGDSLDRVIYAEFLGKGKFDIHMLIPRFIDLSEKLFSEHNTTKSNFTKTDLIYEEHFIINSSVNFVLLTYKIGKQVRPNGNVFYGVKLTTNYYKNERTKPAILLYPCPHLGKEQDEDDENIKILIYPANTPGCIRVVTFGYPRPEIAVAEMATNSKIVKILKNNSSKYISNIFQTFMTSHFSLPFFKKGQVKNFVAVAQNTEGMAIQHFRFIPYETIKFSDEFDYTEETQKLAAMKERNNGVVDVSQRYSRGSGEKIFWHRVLCW